VFIGVKYEAATAICNACREEIIKRLKDLHDVGDVDFSLNIAKITEEYLSDGGATLFGLAPDTKPSASAGKSDALAPDSDDAVEICFRPFWSAENEVIGAYLTMLRRPTPTGIPRYGYAALDNPDNAKRIAAADLAMLHASYKALSATGDVCDRYLLVTPIHYPTFRRPKWNLKYRQALDEIPAEIRKRICLHVTGLKSPTMVEHMILDMGYLKKCSRLLFVHLPLGGRGFAALANTPIDAAGTSIYGHDLSPAELRVQLSKFARKADSISNKLYVTGVQSESDVMVARECGFEMVAGPVVGDVLEAPQPLHFKTAEEILKPEKALADVQALQPLKSRNTCGKAEPLATASSGAVANAAPAGSMP